MDSPNKNRILEGLKQAIQAEHDGHGFYLMASRGTDDPQAKEIFGKLAAEELDHHRYLRAQYQAILKTGSVDPGAKLGPRLRLADESPIFSPSFKERVGQAQMEMSALSIGIQLELGAMNFYKGEAEAADDPAVKAFYEELAAWESGHYHALLNQQEALKDDYWAGSGFSPF
jgi:rubrerythrin